MLYDTTADVIRKALRGLDLAPSEAAARSELPEREVIAASRGPASRETLARLAPALGLDPAALADLPRYQPEACPPAGIERLELPFDDETVNAWLLDTGGPDHLLCDAGDGQLDVRRVLEARMIRQAEVLITHEHDDHVGGLRGLGEMVRSLRGPKSLQPGEVIRCGKLSIRVIGLPGHCAGALGYVVEGSGVPACVTGDAIFAGSIGGCAPGEPYRQALEALRSEVMSLPDETILLPGHGPATTVGSERRSNPFLAK